MNATATTPHKYTNTLTPRYSPPFLGGVPFRAGWVIRHALTLLTSALLVVVALTTQAQNNVGIGTIAPNSKAILELKATNKGFIAPRMNTTQMLAIAPTATEAALLVYNTDSACYHFYNGTAWKNLCQKSLDTAAINKAIKNYLNSNATTIINILKGDTSLFNYTTINNAVINILKVDTSITNVAIINNAIINLLKVDSSNTNYAYINNAVIDSAKVNYINANTGNFNTLNVGGQNIMNTITDSIAAQAWLLKGNNATATNQLGTLNARNLNIITNNTTRMSIMSGTGNVGIGQTLPAEKLDVIGNIQTTGSLAFGTDLKPAGLPGTTNDILISQGAGVAPKWVAPTTIVPTTTNTLANPTNTITSTVNGVVATAPAVNTVANTSAGNNLTTTVNGVAGATVPIVNANTLTNPVNTITSSINGVVATAPAVNTVSNSIVANNLTTTVNGVSSTAVPLSVSGGCYVHYIGELFEGGIIAALWKQGGAEHGLILSLTDIDTTTKYWSNVRDKVLVNQTYYDGAANTNAIIAQVGHTSSAALTCRSYTGGGFTDWYLPSVGEFEMIAPNIPIISIVLGEQNSLKMEGSLYANPVMNSTARTKTYTGQNRNLYLVSNEAHSITYFYERDYGVGIQIGQSWNRIVNEYYVEIVQNSIYKGADGNNVNFVNYGTNPAQSFIIRAMRRF